MVDSSSSLSHHQVARFLRDRSLLLPAMESRPNERERGVRGGYAQRAHADRETRLQHRCSLAVALRRLEGRNEEQHTERIAYAAVELATAGAMRIMIPSPDSRT